MGIHGPEYFNNKWNEVIRQLPTGGQYRLDLRKKGYQIACDAIPEGSKVFDYASGLSIIGEMLKEKDCEISGCDFSPVAVNWNKENVGLNFYEGSEIIGKYDVVIGSQILEHFKKPEVWLEMAFNAAPVVICLLPRNFIHAGEHVDMAWSNWASFEELFSDYDYKRIDIFPGSDFGTNDDKDLRYIRGSGAFAHPIVQFTKKGIQNAPNKTKTIKSESSAKGGSKKTKRIKKTIQKGDKK